MKVRIFGFAIAVVVGSALPANASLVWNGSVSSDVTDGANWNGGVVPSSTDRAIIGGSSNSPNVGSDVTWRDIQLNGSTTIDGSSTVTLARTSSLAFQAVGGGDSVVNANLSATRDIETNNSHNVTFNGTISARKIQGFGSATASYNGSTTVTAGFVTIGSNATVVYNGPFAWNSGGEKNFNAGGTLVFGPSSSFTSNGNIGLGTLNVFDGGTIRTDGDNLIGANIDIWGRNNTTTFELNGFSQSVEYLGTSGSASMIIDFGLALGANSLVWDNSVNSNGSYDFINFEPGVDKLEFGQTGFTDLSEFTSMTLNGLTYSSIGLGPGIDYWTTIPTPDPGDDPDRQIAVIVAAVPEPSTLMPLTGVVFACLSRGARRR